jgi:predicted ATPase
VNAEFAKLWAARIEELRLCALESSIDARLALGDHAAVAAELAHLVRKHPWRERLRGQQMLALYRSGRAPEALAVYRSARERLVEDLGLEPGPELRALETGILRQEPTLSLTPAREPAKHAGRIGGPCTEPSTFECARWGPTGGTGGRVRGNWEFGLLVEDHGGRLLEVEEGRLVAAFPDARNAVAAAAALATDRERTARVAVHSGEAFAIGGDFVGPAPEWAQRLAAAAHPGQVLVSAAAAELVRGKLPNGFELCELGAPRLADLGRPQMLYQLTGGGLASEFPGLRSLEDVPTNLPVYQDPFVGRGWEVRKIGRMLQETRLLTLTGAGGCGKTRLATQAAAELLPTFGGGVFIVELAPVADPRLVAGALATALGLPKNPRLRTIDAVTRHLSDRQVLVLLDTCEHLLGACAELVERLTGACREVRVLATSRERLGAPGELVWTVPPLGLPTAPRSSGGDESVLEADAARLLIERAVALRQDLRLAPAEARAAARICRRLEGLPLAIELAAARVPALGFDRVAERLEMTAGLRFLRRPRPIPGGRHETMELALDWSFGLLAAHERLLLSRLSVFAGGFTLEEAEAVAGGPELEGAGVEEPLVRLVEKSMVVADQAEEGSFHYRLLEPIRDYAAAKLAERGETEKLRARHAEWFMALAEKADRGLHGPEEQRWLDRLEASHDNLRAALGWATDRSVADLALRLAGAMWWFWYTHGHLDEGRHWLGRVLALPSPAAARVKPLQASAHLAWWQGDFAHTVEACEEVLAHPDERDERWGRAWSTMGLATIATVTQDDLDPALALAEESVSTFRELTSDWELGYGIATLGLVLLYRKEYERAAEAFDESIRIQSAVGQTPDLAVALRYRGLIGALLGDTARANALCERSKELASKHEDRSGEAQAYNLLATVARSDDDLDRARPLYGDALAIAHEIGEILDVGWALDGLAGVACRDGELGLAARLLAKADEIGRLVSYRLPPIARAAHDADTATARAGLPARDFEAAWAAGESMSLDHVVEEARAFAERERPVSAAVEYAES